MKIPKFLKSFEAYKSQYLSGLARLYNQCLDPSSLVTIVACNSLRSSWSQFSPEELVESFRLSLREFEKIERQNSSMKMAPEDKAVFDAMLSQGSNEFLEPAIERRVGPFVAGLFPFRNLRPVNEDSDKSIGRYTDYDPKKDALFAQQSIKDECFWTGEIDSIPTWVFPNKFPNLTGHSLFVPWPEQRLYQEMTETVHNWIWDLVETVGNCIPSFSMGFNSIGAGATQKQLHLQATVESDTFPVSEEVWAHNGGSRIYPGQVEVSLSKLEAWKAITSICLSSDTITYCLLYLPGKIFILPGKPRGLCQIPWWGTGVGFCDRAGRITVSNREAFEQVSEGEIETVLKSWSVI